MENAVQIAARHFLFWQLSPIRETEYKYYLLAVATPVLFFNELVCMRYLKEERCK